MSSNFICLCLLLLFEGKGCRDLVAFDVEAATVLIAVVVVANEDGSNGCCAKVEDSKTSAETFSTGGAPCLRIVRRLRAEVQQQGR